MCSEKNSKTALQDICGGYLLKKERKKKENPNFGQTCSLFSFSFATSMYG